MSVIFILVTLIFNLLKEKIVTPFLFALGKVSINFVFCASYIFSTQKFVLNGRTGGQMDETDKQDA